MNKVNEKQTKMAFIDRAIAAVAPGWAASREKSRLEMEQMSVARGAVANYRGGTNTRTNRSWPRSPYLGGISDTDRRRIAQMRDRARKAASENPIAAGILSRLVDNVVGNGAILHADTGDKDLNARLESDFERFMNNADIRGVMTGRELQRQIFASHERDGDVAIHLVERESGNDKIQVIEGDAIATPEDKLGQNTQTSRIKDGIEYGRFGDLVALHVFNGENPDRTRKYARIKPGKIIFYPRLDRASGVRGVSCFSQCFELLDQLDAYIDAVVTAARMAAIFGLIFKEKNSALTQSQLPFAKNASGDDQRAFKLENGSLKYTGPEDDIVQVQAHQPMQQTPDFIVAMLRQIGLPLSMPLELIGLDFSRTNLSSARAGLLQFYRAMEPKQHLFNDKVMTRIYEWWLRRQIDRGVYAETDLIYRHKFGTGGWRWIDPIKDSQEALLKISMNVDSYDSVAKSLGKDVVRVIEKNAETVSLMEENGLDQVLSNLTRDRGVSQPEPDTGDGDD